jgi:DNA-binding response OmpR family regulator
MQHGDWWFSPDLINARHLGRGTEIRLTRAERRLLAALVARPGRLRSRQALLDMVSGPGSDASDRSVDYLVSRLRRKLGDSARRPRYIATHYGEGYIWIADGVPDAGA